MRHNMTADCATVKGDFSAGSSLPGEPRRFAAPLQFTPFQGHMTQIKVPQEDAGMNDDVVRQRIQERMDALDLTMNAAAKLSGLHRSMLRKFMAGDTKELRGSSIDKLAPVLQCTSAYLRGDEAEFVAAEPKAGPQGAALSRPLERLTRPMQNVKIVGVVEAGAFRPVDFFEDAELGDIVNGFDPKYRELRQFGFKVRGDSMDLAGIRDGCEIVCVCPAEAQVEPGDGDLVVVENSLDGGHTRELTVKRLHRVGVSWELRPESSNPRHKPIVIPSNSDPNDGREVRIVGLVIGVVRRFDLRRSAPRGLLEILRDG